MNYIKRKWNKWFNYWHGWCDYHDGIGFDEGDGMAYKVKMIWIGNPRWFQVVTDIKITLQK